MSYGTELFLEEFANLIPAFGPQSTFLGYFMSILYLIIFFGIKLAIFYCIVTGVLPLFPDFLNDVKAFFKLFRMVFNH